MIREVGFALLLFWPFSLSAAQLLPRSTRESILNAISGERALEHTRALSGFPRYPSSRGFQEAAAYVMEEAKRIGLESIRMESFPAPGPRWDLEAGELWLEEPERRLLASAQAVPLSVAQFSRDADLKAELVDVGRGVSEADYREVDVRGKIVLASGDPQAVHREAVDKRKAAGVVSFFQKEFFGVSPPREAVSWGSLSWKGPEGQRSSFAFVLSPRDGERLRSQLRSSKLVVRARIKVETEELATYDMVTAEIPGSLAGQDIVLSAHLDHQPPGANDNASGSAALLELARAARELIASGEVPRPARKLRFWWLTEFESTYAYFVKYPAEAGRILANINLDQEGGDIRIPSDFVYTQSLRWLPTYLNDLLRAFSEEASRLYAPPLHEPSSLFTAPTGSRIPHRASFWADGDPMPGSDNYAFTNSLIGVPSNSIAAPSLRLIHTSEDKADYIDPTCLKRGIYLSLAPALFLASGDSGNGLKLLGLVAGEGRARMGEELARSLQDLSGGPGSDLSQVYTSGLTRLRQRAEQEGGAIESVRPLLVGHREAAELLEEEKAALSSHLHQLEARLRAFYRQLAKAEPREPEPTARERELGEIIPRRQVALGPGAERWFRFRSKSLSGGASYYLANLVDGRRSIAGIHRATAVFFPELSLDQVEAYLREMEKEELVRLDRR